MSNSNVTDAAATQNSKMEELLKQQGAIQIPRVGDLISGKVLAVTSSEVHLDINGILTGVIRGYELEDESGEYSKLKVGDEVTATVTNLENEGGEMELSFREASHQKAWANLKNLMAEKKIVAAEIIDANRGGLMIKVRQTVGFLPVSQLTPEHYPRVDGGDKRKILEILNSYIGTKMKVLVIDANETENKLIVSEKAAWEISQKEIFAKYKVGDTVEGIVTGVVDFGAFVEFADGLEGLVHISELGWQRIDDPRDFIRRGQKIKAEIIDIQGSKISLSIKRTQKDPWTEATKKYLVGQTVQGKVLKINPFGIFVELDTDIHGLAHISELSEKKITSPEELVKIGGTYDFKIISIEPKEHRLGLSLKALKPKVPATAAEAKTPAEKIPAPIGPTEEKKTAVKPELPAKEAEIETATDAKTKIETKPAKAKAETKDKKPAKKPIADK